MRNFLAGFILGSIAGFTVPGGVALLAALLTGIVIGSW